QLSVRTRPLPGGYPSSCQRVLPLPPPLLSHRSSFPLLPLLCWSDSLRVCLPPSAAWRLSASCCLVLL
ncbi:hypothetical protein CHARACLAT_030832, partial [Characodon lateralis]|nr:hypothetical protein [Characodon lateralis]